MTALTTIPHSTAEIFLAALRLSNDVWWPADASASPWVFRGVGDADEWKLLPSAWRLDASNDLKLLHTRIQRERFDLPCDEDDNGIWRRYHEWRAAEKEALFQFATRANEAGFKVEASAYERCSSPLSTRCLGTAGGKRAVEDIDLTALAQHHGIPTRLLDWSVNPMAAAFFAASPPFRPETSNAICVWALNRNDVRRSSEGERQQRKPRVVVHEPPRGNNRYLHAQGGIFTEIEITFVERFFCQHSWFPSLEDVFSAETATPSTLIGHRLSGNEVPRLLQLLEREGMNFAVLMPSLDKIAGAVKAGWRNFAGVPLPPVGGPSVRRGE